jgi:two-component system sensor histidine kinase YcbA
MVYIYPFHTQFRFTISVAILATLLLFFARVPIFATALISGIIIFAGRSTAHLIFNPADLWQATLANFPAIVYYAAYGLSFEVLGVRRYINNIPVLILLLSVCDLIGNSIELFIRAEPLAGSFDTMASSIIGVAILRSLLTTGSYYALRRYHAFVLSRNRAEHYARQTVMIAQLKAELYYLKKSSQDIERVMAESYLLYKKLSAKKQPGRKIEADTALAVARNIHEVKKNYTRVIAGFETVLQPSADITGMRLSEVFAIIEQNTRRFVAGLNKQIDISFVCLVDFVTNKHYAIVSILDNLIINAIEACGDNCRIAVSGQQEESGIVFAVHDNGCGVKPEDCEILFQAGYSTKFDAETGKMSTGLGLAHVKNLAALLQGAVSVKSEQGNTLFKVSIPKENLLVEENRGTGNGGTR